MGQIRKRLTGSIAPGVSTAVKNANTKLVAQPDNPSQLRNAVSNNSRPGVKQVKGAVSKNG